MRLQDADVRTVMARVGKALARWERARQPETPIYVDGAEGDGLGIRWLREPARIDTRFASGSARPVVGPAVRLAKRAVRRGISWYVEPMMAQQSRFNAAVLDLAERMELAHERLLTDLDERLPALRDDIDALEARFSEGGPGATGGEGLLPSARRLLQYRAFEDRHRGPYADIRTLLSFYLPLFAGRRRVLDVGCGRGEFLRLLQEEGIDAYGVDSDESMVESARAHGLDVVLGDGISHLRRIGRGSVDGIFSSQVVEHLQTSQIMGLLEAAHEKLAPGGVMVVETPNPESLFIFHAFFYVDLTHVKPIHPEALKWAMEAVGFAEVRLERILPVPDGTRLDDVPDDLRDQPGWSTVAANVERLNQLLYGPQHFAAVATKAG